MSNVLEAFPDIRIRLQKNKKTGKIEMGADVKICIRYSMVYFCSSGSRCGTTD